MKYCVCITIITQYSWKPCQNRAYYSHMPILASDLALKRKKCIKQEARTLANPLS